MGRRYCLNEKCQVGEGRREQRQIEKKKISELIRILTRREIVRGGFFENN